MRWRITGTSRASSLAAPSLAALALLVLAGLGPAPAALAALATTDAPHRGTRAPAVVPPARSGTAVTLGQVAASPSTCAPVTVVQLVATPGTPGYLVPSAGVVTSFSYNANSTAGQVRLTAFGASAVANHLTLTGRSPLQTVVPNAIDSFPVRVPVKAGQVLGLQTTVNLMGCVGSSTGERVLGSFYFNPDTSTDLDTTSMSSFADVRVNLSAIVEPDVDGDGFGDLSQDLCPQSAKTQAACPAPDTRLRKPPPTTGHNRSVRFTFTSTTAGSRFQCSLDRHRFQRCHAPLAEKLGFGKHRFAVRAVSPAGIVDPTPASVAFTITPKH